MTRRVEGRRVVGQYRPAMADKRRRGPEKRAGTNDRKLFVRIPVELEDALQAYADRHRWSLSGAARNILIDALLPSKKLPPS